MKAANMRAQLVAQIAGQLGGGVLARGDYFDAADLLHKADEIVQHLEGVLLGEPIYKDRPAFHEMDTQP